LQGLEVIEAHYLFGSDYDDIEIVIHPQSIIHSLVETQVKTLQYAVSFCLLINIEILTHILKDESHYLHRKA